MIAFSNALHAWSIFAKYAVYRTATDTVARPDHPDPGREEKKRKLIFYSHSSKSRSCHDCVEGVSWIGVCHVCQNSSSTCAERAQGWIIAASTPVASPKIGKRYKKNGENFLFEKNIAAASGGGGGGGSGGGGDEDGPVEEELSDQLLDGALCGRAHLRSAVPLLGSLVSDAARKLAALDRGGSAVPEVKEMDESLHVFLN